MGKGPVFCPMGLEQNVKWSQLTSPRGSHAQRTGGLSVGGVEGVGGVGVQEHRLALPASRAATLWALLCGYLDRTLWRWSGILCFQSRKSDLCKQSPEALQTWRSLQEGDLKLYRRTIGGWPGPGQPWRRLPAEVCFHPSPQPAGQSSRWRKGPQKDRSAHPFTGVPVRRGVGGPQLQHTPRQPQRLPACLPACRGAQSNTFLHLLTWMLRQALHLQVKRQSPVTGNVSQNSRLGFNNLLSMLHRRET